MHRSHKIRLNPNSAQATYFAKACGVTRLSYNWGLAKWKELYEAGEKTSGRVINKEFTKIKRTEFPFITEVTKCAPETAFNNLDNAFKNFFRNLKKGNKKTYPRFKKKGTHDSFAVDNSKFKVNGNKIRIPKLGWVRMTEELRFKGKMLSATISKIADKWFVSILVEMPDEDKSKNQTLPPVGVDLGIKTLATLSDGVIFDNIKATKLFERRLRRLNKSLAKKQRRSNRWKKAKLSLSKCHYKISCIRNSAIHKMTRFVANNYSTVCLEDLNVSGMVKNRHLSKAISDVSFGEIRRQIEYKTYAVSVVDRFFPSTKLCMDCGKKHDMPLSKRIFECCQGPIDRDLHAAQNILRQGLSEIKHVETKALADRPRSAKLLSVKREVYLNLLGTKRAPYNFL